MYQNLWLTISDYMNFYYRSLCSAWDNMTPMQYGGILITIAVIGWVLMKSDR